MIEPLNKNHLKKEFNSGHGDLDNYLKHLALQDLKRYLARIYVAVQSHENQIIGFYTLAATGINLSSFSEDIIKKIPYKIVPAILIGRLAIDLNWQNKGLGKMLLMDSLFQSLHASVGAKAIIVDAKNIEVKAFYKKFGFLEFQDTPLKLYIIMETVKKAFSNL